MASRALPATPASDVATVGSTTATPSPGTWRHPRFHEITRRQNASTFNEKHVSKVAWNLAALILSFFVGSSATSLFYNSKNYASITMYSEYILIAIRLCLCFNIMTAFLPLLRSKDNVVDIPLTPSQRTLLGLDPNIKSIPTSNSEYATPPRYPRSSASRTGRSRSRSSSFSYSASPLSGRGSSSLAKNLGNSLYSPAASPLLQKAIGSGLRESSRRHSYSSLSSFGQSLNGKESFVTYVPPSPSPSGPKSSGTGMPSRWIYEKGRLSSSSRGFSDW